MKMITQRTKWDCRLCAICMVADISYDYAVTSLGHDGSEIIFPKNKEPFNRVGFNPVELANLCLNHFYSMMEIPSAVVIEDSCEGQSVEYDNEDMILTWMNRFDGIIDGMYALDRPHSVAWDHEKKLILDPCGRQYEFFGDGDSITIGTFYPIIPIKNKTLIKSKNNVS